MNREEQWLLMEKYKGEKTGGFVDDCERLATGEPLGYVIGFVPFLDCQIWLDSKPLIPRPETEYWTQKAIKSIKESSNTSGITTKILDLCAGSGAVGVTVAKALPEALVTFAEIDTTHLPTIRKNLAENSSVNRTILDKNYQVIESDLFANLPSDVQYDFILTNPPYIDAEANTVENSVTSFEPHLALFGGNAGMEIIERIISRARALLAPQGQLWIEHEPFQSEEIALIAGVNNFKIETHCDQYNVERYSILVIK